MAEWLARPQRTPRASASASATSSRRASIRSRGSCSATPTTCGRVFTAGPQRTNAGEANEILRPTLGPHSLLLLDGDEHMRERKLMLPAFHGERIDRYRQIMREATERAIAAWPAGDDFALRGHTQAITLEVIMRAVFGVEDAGAMARLRAPLKRFVDWAGHPGALVMVALLGFETRSCAGSCASATWAPSTRALRADRRAPRGARSRPARRHPLAAAARPRRGRRADDATPSCATSS